MPKRIDITGQKFNRLTAIEYMGLNKNRLSTWLFRCDCGNEKVIVTQNVKSGLVKSCGCYSKECNSKRFTTHGKTNTKEYHTYYKIKDRCYNKSCKEYRLYGQRGIVMCDRWLESFENFFKDMGYAPTSDHSIDRIDVDGIYEPTNCKWSTKQEQNRNKRNTIYITYNNEMHDLKTWCEILNKDYNRTYLRIKQLNWSIDKAFQSD